MRISQTGCANRNRRRVEAAGREFEHGLSLPFVRPHDLGSTQWYVLWQLSNNGPTVQRDFLNVLQVEKPTLSEVVSGLARKGFIQRTPAAADQRQRLLTITR